MRNKRSLEVLVPFRTPYSYMGVSDTELWPVKHKRGGDLSYIASFNQRFADARHVYKQ